MRAHDPIKDLVAIRATEGDAVFGGIQRKDSFCTECTLNEQGHWSLDGVLHPDGEVVEPRSVDVVELDGFPGGNKNTVQRTVERETEVPRGPRLGELFSGDCS